MMNSKVQEYFGWLIEDTIPELTTIPGVRDFLSHTASYTSGKTDHAAYGFASTFFPVEADRRRQPEVANIINVSDETWSCWNKALITQGLCSDNPYLRNFIHSNEVDSVVAELSRAYKEHSTELMIQALRRKAGEQSITKEDYKKLLLSPEWRNKVASQQASLTYHNGEWKIYCHFAKYAAAGADDRDIQEIYGILTGTEPKLSFLLRPETWRAYPWCEKQLCGSMLRMSRTTESYKFPSSSFAGGSVISYTAESSYAREFVCRTRWFFEPSSSCFHGDTGVLMEDGGFAPISRLRPGDRVRTPGGAGTVAFLSQVYRNGRKLYGFAGTDAWFTADHPVCLEDGGIGFVYPGQARERIFTFKHMPVKKLDENCRLSLYRSTAEPLTAPCPRLLVKQDAKQDELLYDLFLERLEPYFVGNRRLAFCVLPEMPALGMYPLAEGFILNVLRRTGMELSRLDERRTAENSLEFYRRAGRWAERAFEDASGKVLERKGQGSFDEPVRLSQIMTNQQGFSKNTGMLSDALIAKGQMIYGDIEMGYRIFGSAPGPFMGISVYYADLSGAEGFQMLCLDRVCHRKEHYRLEVALKGEQFHAVILIPRRLTARKNQLIYLYDGYSRLRGTALISIRFLTEEAKCREEKIKALWNEEMKQQFALRASEACASGIRREFANTPKYHNP